MSSLPAEFIEVVCNKGVGNISCFMLCKTSIAGTLGPVTFLPGGRVGGAAEKGGAGGVCQVRER